VRLTSGGGLRSPGSFEESFALAAFAVLAACVALTVASRRQAVLLWVAVVAVIAATQVRTAALQLAVLVLLVLVRKGKILAAGVGVVGAAAGAVLVAGVFIVSATVPGGPVRPLLFTLNGRFDAWAVAYQGPSTLVRGNGVGALGAGSTRAEAGLVSQAPAYDPNKESAALFAGNSAFIDSSWGQVLSDVGLVGVVALLAWVVAYCWWLRVPAREGSGAAWLALAVLAVSVVDWLSRTTLGSYPTGFTTLYLLGLATSAALTVRPDRLRPSTRETVA
jgi:O-antigen ligase